MDVWGGLAKGNEGASLNPHIWPLKEYAPELLSGGGGDLDKRMKWCKWKEEAEGRWNQSTMGRALALQAPTLVQFPTLHMVPRALPE